MLVGMYRLDPNWWDQSGAGECKGSRPALPLARTTVEVHRSYTAAAPQLALEAYICLGGWPPDWGVFYLQYLSGVVYRVIRLSSSTPYIWFREFVF